MSMKIETLEVAGFAPAFKGLRNPKNSWRLSDSYVQINNREDISADFVIGEKDLKLAQSLIKAGAEHCKFLRQIQVWADVNMPRYVWSEWDTYKFNTKNSCSTMHKLFEKDKEITLDNFVYNGFYEEKVLLSICKELNKLNEQYFLPSTTSEMKNTILTTAKRILPESYLQLRTVNTTYAELRNMYFQRVKHPHRLKLEWVQTFGDWIESLPYSKELIMFE